MTNWSKIREVLRTDPDRDDRDLKNRRFEKSARNRGLFGNTYGPASKARRLTGKELEARRAELEKARSEKVDD